MSKPASRKVRFATEMLLGAACFLLLFAAAHDFAARTVPNWSSVSVFVVGMTLRVLQGDWIMGLVVGLLVLAGSMFCWMRGWLGGGDVKLLAAVSVLVAPVLAMQLLLAVSLAGGVLAIVYLGLRWAVPSHRSLHPRGLIGRILRAECYRIRRKGPIPYASAIAAGAIVVLLNG